MLSRLCHGTNEGINSKVPIERYKKNLLAMYSLYSSDIPTIFVTPTPFMSNWQDRDPAVTKQYGEAAKDLAKELDCGIVDSQKEFEGRDLPPLFKDGLHLLPAGYEVSERVNTSQSVILVLLCLWR